MYQKENIVSQIKSCINFPTTEINKINMPSKIEVLEHNKEKSLRKSDKEITEIKEIDLMDYLECELEIRKKLNEKVICSLNEKEESISKLRNFEKFYSDLPKYLESLENSTLKTQNYLNLNLNEKNKKLNLSGKLPPPLFILYNLLLCFSDEAIESEVNIKGKESQADEFYSKYACFFDCCLNNVNNLNKHSFSGSWDNIIEQQQTDEAAETKQREEGEHSEGEIEDEEAAAAAVERKNAANKKKKKKRKFFFNESSAVNCGGKVVNNQLLNNTFNDEQADFRKLVFKLASRDEKISKFPLFVEFVIKKPLQQHQQDEFVVGGDNYSEANKCLFPICFNFYFIPVVNLISVDIVNSQQSVNNSSISPNYINILKKEVLEANLKMDKILVTIDRCERLERKLDKWRLVEV